MTILLAIAISVTAAVGAVSLLLVLRRWAPADGYWGNREPNHSGSAIAVMGSAFAVLVAFVLSLVFSGFQDAQHGAQQEAQATEAIYQQAGELPAGTRSALRGAVACYALAVVRTDWGTGTDVAQHWPPVLATIEQRADFSDPRQLRTLDQLDVSEHDRVDGYIAREEHDQASVPAILWLALIAGGVLLVGYLCVFARPLTRTVLQVYMVGAVAAIGALNLCVIRFLDTPFSGSSGSVHPAAMRYVLAEMHTSRLALPCDARGRPLAGARS